MSDIGAAVHIYLQTQSGVTDLCGTRGYPENLEQGGELPAYTYTVVSSTPDNSLQGCTGYVASRVQVDAYASTHLAAYALAEAIRVAMLAQPPPTMNSVDVDVVVDEGSFSRSEDPKDGSDNWRHRISRDFVIGHAEAIPS